MDSKDRKSVESEHLFNLARKRYGHRLTPAELEEIRVGIETIVENAEALRAVKLENSTEPSTVFKPLIRWRPTR